MIIDTLSNAEKYFCMHPLFEKAFEFVKSININTIKVGKYEILGDDIKGIVISECGRTMKEVISKFESHDKYIDVHLCVNGQEEIGWKPRQKCIYQRGRYNADKDVIFYNDTPDTYFKLTNNQFAILFPEDVHAAMIGKGEIKKIVIKVKC